MKYGFYLSDQDQLEKYYYYLLAYTLGHHQEDRSVNLVQPNAFHEKYYKNVNNLYLMAAAFFLFKMDCQNALISLKIEIKFS